MLQEINFLNYIHLAAVINEYAYFEANVSSRVYKIKCDFFLNNHIQKIIIMLILKRKKFCSKNISNNL